MTTIKRTQKVFSEEKVQHLLFGVLLVPKFPTSYDMLVNIFRDYLSSRFALPESTGTANRTRTKAARTESVQV